MNVAAECRKVSEWLADAAREVEHANKKAEAAREGHEGQLRNTLAFQKECEALRAQLRALGVEPCC